MSIQPVNITHLPREALTLIGSLTHELHPSLFQTCRSLRAVYQNLQNKEERILTPLWQRCQVQPSMAQRFPQRVLQATYPLQPSLAIRHIILSQKEELNHFPERNEFLEAQIKCESAFHFSNFFKTNPYIQNIQRPQKIGSYESLLQTEQFLKDKNLLLFITHIQANFPTLNMGRIRAENYSLHTQAEAVRTWLRANSETVRAITHLFLSETNLTQIPAEISLFTGLTHLDLENNAIKHIPANIFQGLIHLQWLYLNNNQIQVLPPTLFQGLIQLQWLYLNNNQIQAFPPTLFQGLTQIQDLDLYNNQIQVLPPTLFQGLIHLLRWST
ncbi:MAG: leucine-rich repeat domain-containing protein [Chlamydiota bacterium]